MSPTSSVTISDAAGPVLASIGPARPTPIEGVIVGRALDTEAVISEMFCNWSGPGTVPVLRGHRGDLLGYVDTIERDWRDLRFWASIAYHVREGVSVPVSIEYGDKAYPRWDGKPHPYVNAGYGTHYRGTIGYGRNLIGIALLLSGEMPLAYGSVCWSVAE